MEEARSDIKFKTDTIHSLELKIEGLESDFKKDLQAIKEKAGNHSKCKKEIDGLKETLSRKDIEISDIKSEMDDVRNALQDKIEAVMKEKDEERNRFELKIKEERESLIKEV